MTDETDYQELRDDIRSYLEHRVENGNRYVKCKWIANAIGVTSQAVAHQLDPFLDDGTLAIYSDANVASTYKITLNENHEHNQDQ